MNAMVIICITNHIGFKNLNLSIFDHLHNKFPRKYTRESRIKCR